jgi:hypothetical protein
VCVCTCDAQCSFSVSDAMLNGFLSGMEISPREGFWIDPKVRCKPHAHTHMRIYGGYTHTHTHTVHCGGPKKTKPHTRYPA